MNKKATIIGATGLIGNELLELLISDTFFSPITIISRRPINCNHPKVTIKVIQFDDNNAFENALQDSHSVFCCVGTTQKKVKGNKDNYRKVDFDIPVRAAFFAEKQKCKHFSFISSIGANSLSSNFYLHLKGETENSVTKYSIPSIAIYRPSMLLGKRKELRPAEEIAKFISCIFSIVIPTSYKPIHAKTIAKAMINNAKLSKQGISYYTYAQITKSI
jgi:uncharacterized protein YbjT (DUF2867 family)